MLRLFAIESRAQDGARDKEQAAAFSLAACRREAYIEGGFGPGSHQFTKVGSVPVLSN